MLLFHVGLCVEDSEKGIEVVNKGTIVTALNSMLNATDDQMRHCQMYLQALDHRVTNDKPVTVPQFNTLFESLNKYAEASFRTRTTFSTSVMETRHLGYLLMIKAKLIPNIATFNVLLRGIRHTRPLQFGFMQYLIDQMTKFQVPMDTRWYSEIIYLYSLYPTTENVAAADYWFYDGYVKSLNYVTRGKQLSSAVLDSYLKVYLAAGNYEGAERLKQWALCYHPSAWSARLRATFRKMGNASNHQVLRLGLGPSSFAPEQFWSFSCV